MSLLRFFSVAVVCCAFSALAQTYTPKTLRLEGADDVDKAAVMRLIDLKPGTPVTKEQIDAAMQRMIDSGLFSDLSYKVGPDALVFLVKPVPAAQALPVRYSNFVWWQPGELEPLVEARVPLFHGKLPLTGQLTDQVEAALVALLAQKGIADASVTARLSSIGGSGMNLAIIQPNVILGEVHLSGIAPAASGQMHKVLAGLSAEEFDNAETADAIVSNTLDTHRNAGYLDVSMDPPVFSAPRKESSGYAVDATSAVHAGELYRISAVTFEGFDPKQMPEITRTSDVKPGDPAGEMTLRIAAGLTARAFENRGMLEAKATAQVSKDPSTHTAACHFTVVAGPVYTFAGVDLSALSPEMQRRFLGDFHAKPGAVADLALRTEMLDALRSSGAPKAVGIQSSLDRSAHTARYILIPTGVASGQSGAS